MKTLVYLIIIGSFLSCLETNNQTMKKQTKNYSCDIKTGVCSDSNEEANIEEVNYNPQKKVKLIYYTDPICSACWAIIPELKKFKLAYGQYFDVEYKMGGLVKNWDGFEDGANGISKPADVAPHWDEVGAYSEMSIDGDVWIEDPLASSYPPSIAFKAMQKQGQDIALKYLRRIREMVFLEKKNIAKEAILLQAVREVNGDTKQFLSDYHNEEVKQSFYNEISQGREMGVRGFPTFIFINEAGKGFKISGMSGYDNYIKALEKAVGESIKPKTINLTELELLQKDKFLATKEIYFILSQRKEETLLKLHQLEKEGLIKKEKQKFNEFWRYVK